MFRNNPREKAAINSPHKKTVIDTMTEHSRTGFPQAISRNGAVVPINKRREQFSEPEPVL
jgi:hypothetical protein